MTIDEELSLLDSQLRRLKIEYEIYFSNPAKRPPTDVEWKVLSLLRKFSDGGRMSFSQRFRYNEIAQRYAIYSDLWRKKNRIREEGYRRPQDAILSVQGVRPEEREPEHKVYGVGHSAAAAAGVAAASEAGTGAAQAASPVEVPLEKPFSVECGDVRAERDQVRKLYQALTEAKKKSGEAASGNLDSFSSFVQKKTEQIRKQYGCQAVEYTVETQNGQVKLKARAKV
ncbi:MAG TPA: MXAN_5187 C-terminal domain-containing protein [Terriglobales bacterium]|nr:MXAN_5187 C-terminal domain-containing protein [Terriglobales bacterium]